MSIGSDLDKVRYIESNGIRVAVTAQWLQDSVSFLPVDGEGLPASFAAADGINLLDADGNVLLSTSGLSGRTPDEVIVDFNWSEEDSS